MGVQVAITLDSQLKPNYTVSTVLAPAFAVAAGELVAWWGNDLGAGKHFEVTGVRKCLEGLRSGGTLTPTSGKHSYGKVTAPGFSSAVSTGFDVADITTLTGTVTVSAGTKAVVGVATLFTTELVVGDVIKIGTEFHTVATITDALNLVLAANHVAGAAGAVYSISNTPSEQDVGIWYGDLFQPHKGSTVTPHVLRAIEKYLETTQKAA
jgi:hypothetical protein